MNQIKLAGKDKIKQLYHYNSWLEKAFVDAVSLYIDRQLPHWVIGEYEKLWKCANNPDRIRPIVMYVDYDFNRDGK